MSDTAFTPPAEKPRDLSVPLPSDMLSTPIGPIPCIASNGEVIRFPAYFELLKEKAGIRFKGGAWAIVSTLEHGTQQHDRFIMLQDAARILVERWLFQAGHKQTAAKLSGMNRDDFLLTCLGSQHQVRVAVGQELLVAIVGKMIELHDLTNSGIHDWLTINSRDPKYTDRRVDTTPF